MTKPSRHHELVVLMQRYSQLGRLLPAEHDLDTGDLVAVAEAGLQQITLAIWTFVDHDRWTNDSGWPNYRYTREVAIGTKFTI